MIASRTAVGHGIIAAGFATILAGCATTPLGPAVQAMPGPGKSFDAFQTDNTLCKGFATDQVKGQADAANQKAAGAAALVTILGAGLGAAVGGSVGDAGTGAAIGAASGATVGTGYGAGNGMSDQGIIQQQYDNAYSQCMYAKGDQVPGFAPYAAGMPMLGAGVPAAVADPMVRSTQSELIRLGYLHGSADGFMGPRTHSAIAGYEQSHGLPVDGSPSPSLLARLQSTPASTGAATASNAPSGNWVAPAGSTTASAPSNWVSPTGSPAATPASAIAPAASSGWVAPTKSQ
jgi:hypothetical protein